MTSTARFVFICAIWVLAFPFLVMLAFGVGGYGTALTLGAIAAISLFAGPLWIAYGMDNRSRWDLVARYVAMFLLLVICVVAIAGIELLIFRANSDGSGWH
jgi:hypothetical protein